MHLFDLDRDIASSLIYGRKYTFKVLLRAYLLNRVGSHAGGGPIWGQDYSIIDLDISNRLAKRFTLTLNKDRFPGQIESPLQGTTASLTILNPDTYFAATQEGAIIDNSRITSGVINISAQVGDVELDYFRGRIAGSPVERQGESIFKLRSSIYDSFQEPVLYDGYGEVNGTVQSLSIDNGELKATGAMIGTGAGTYCAYLGAITFNQNGDLATTFTRSRDDGPDLTSIIGIISGAKLGVYTIEFITPKVFTLTYPDSQVYRGEVNKTLNTEYVIISGIFTEVPEKGDKIEFNLTWSANGNPVSIARNLIEKSLLGNWGQVPGQTLNVAIDREIWEIMERRFEGVICFASITNTDNKVWQQDDPDFVNMPIDCMRAASELLMHVGITPTIKQDGTVTLTELRLFQQNIYSHSDLDKIASGLTIVPDEDQVNTLRVRYGRLGNTTDYTAEYILDKRVSATDKQRTYTINLPHFKLGANTIDVQFFAQTVWRRYFERQATVNITMEENVSLLHLPGDVFRITHDTQPRFSNNLEIIQIRKGYEQNSQLTCAMIQDAEGPFIVLGSDVGDKVNIY